MNEKLANLLEARSVLLEARIVLAEELRAVADKIANSETSDEVWNATEALEDILACANRQRLQWIEIERCE